MTRDDKPMLGMLLNSCELAQRYGHIPAWERGGPKPWHTALCDWWRFVRQRELVDFKRRAELGRRQEEGTRP